MCLNYDHFHVCIILMSLVMVTFLFLGILSRETIPGVANNNRTFFFAFIAYI